MQYCIIITIVVTIIYYYCYYCINISLSHTNTHTPVQLRLWLTRRCPSEVTVWKASSVLSLSLFHPSALVKKKTMILVC